MVRLAAIIRLYDYINFFRRTLIYCVNDMDIGYGRCERLGKKNFYLTVVCNYYLNFLESEIYFSCGFKIINTSLFTYRCLRHTDRPSGQIDVAIGILILDNDSYRSSVNIPLRTAVVFYFLLCRSYLIIVYCGSFL